MAPIIKPRGKLKLVDILGSQNHYPILDRLSLYLNIADFYKLYQVSRELYQLKDYLRRTRLNINNQLRSFVSDPDKFRYQLGKHDALISGCFALNFFELGRGKIPNLDILVEGGSHVDELVNYMGKHEGYEASTAQNDDPDSNTARGRLILSASRRLGVKVRITRTSGTPVQAILTSSYTTASINFITWNKAYSIFPRQTLVDHKFYPLKPLDNDFGSILVEYRNQGWTTRDIIWPDWAKAQSNVNADVRRVGDRFSLVIPLAHSVPQASKPDFVIEHAQFQVLAESTPPWPPRQLSIQAQAWISPALYHRYTFASDSWHRYATERLKRWTLIELYKMEPGKRPRQFESGVPPDRFEISLPRDFEVPETWDYADDQLPIWYREWEQTLRRSVTRSPTPLTTFVPARGLRAGLPRR